MLLKKHDTVSPQDPSASRVPGSSQPCCKQAACMAPLTCYTTHYVVLRAQYQGGLASITQKQKGHKEKGEFDTNNLEIT